MVRYLRNARVAKDINLHPEWDGKLPLLPLLIIGALLQAMLWQQSDVALYGALELELPSLAGRTCRRMQRQSQSLLHARCEGASDILPFC